MNIWIILFEQLAKKNEKSNKKPTVNLTQSDPFVNAVNRLLDTHSKRII